jgi:hypothetical protein
MGGVVKAVTNVVGDAVESVGDVVEDVGQFVVDEVVEPIAKTVEATVDQALEDPIGTAVKVAAITTMNPAIIAAANAAVAVANGASLEEAAISAGKAYIAGEIAQGVSTELQPEFASSGDLTASQAATASRIAGQAAGAAATGGDALGALINGGMNAGVSAVSSEIPGFSEMSRTQQAAVTRAISAELQGKDPSQGLINAAIGAGIDAGKKFSFDFGSTSPSTSGELVNQTVPTQEQQISAPVNPTEQDMDEFYRSIGIEPTSLSNIPASTEDPLAGINTRGNYNEITGKFEYDQNGSMEGPLPESTGSNLSSMDGYTTKDGVTTTPSGESYDLSYLENSREAKSGSDLLSPSRPEKSIGDIATNLLNNINPGYGLAGAGLAGVAALKSDKSKPDQLFYNQDPYAALDVDWNSQQVTGPNKGVVYGQQQLEPEFVQQAAQGGIMSLAAGGQVPSLGGYAAGGNPRLLRGPGDGMSDNIPATISGKQPARLADGEFVVPADVVSHLGNGSTEAGANVLYQMMERVRKARTGNSKQGKQINPQKFVPSKGK